MKQLISFDTFADQEIELPLPDLESPMSILEPLSIKPIKVKLDKTLLKDLLIRNISSHTSR